MREVGQRHAAQAAERIGEADSLASRKRIAAFVVILLIAACVRVAMLVDFVQSNPIAQAPGGDAAVYWDMAARIASGRFVDDDPFLSVPLYPYLLAGVRAIGGGLTAVYVLQLAVHLITGALLGYAATLKFDGAAGLVAMALFFSLEDPAFFSTRLLPSNVQLPLFAIAVWAGHRFCEGGRTGRAVLLGGVIGLLALAYPPALVLIPFLFIWILIRVRPAAHERGPRRAASGTSVFSATETVSRTANRFARGLAASAAACLVIAPATLHNWLACGEFVPLSAHAGITFRQGNAPGSDGTYTRIEGISSFRRIMHRDAARVYRLTTGKEGSFNEVDGFFLSQGFDHLTSDVGRAAALVGRKMYWFLTGRHYGDIYHPTLEQTDGWLHRLWLAPVPTAWIIGPTLAGIFLLRVRRRLNGLDSALLLLPLFVVAAFLYNPRYRVPILPIACMVSAAAGIEAARRVRERSFGPAAFVALFTAASLATGPLNVAMGVDRPEKYRDQFELNKGQVYARLGQYEAAVVSLAVADRLERGRPEVLAAQAGVYLQLNRLDEAERLSLLLQEAEPHSPLPYVVRGWIRVRRAEWPEAQAAFAAGLDLDASEPELNLGMWMVFSSTGRAAQGVEYLETAVRNDPANALSASEYGVWLAKKGDLGTAEHYLQLAHMSAPQQPEILFNLAKVVGEAGRERHAIQLLERALQVDPSYERARIQLERLTKKTPAGEVTAEDLQRAIERDPRDAGLYSTLAGVLYGKGDTAGAVRVLRNALARADCDATTSMELAWLLATTGDNKVRDGAEALGLVEKVLGRGFEPTAQLLDVYAAALAEMGQFDRALREAERAQELATKSGNAALAQIITRRADLYKSRRPYRQP